MNNQEHVRETERREFWKACFLCFIREKHLLVHEAASYADESLEEFDERWKQRS